MAAMYQSCAFIKNTKHFLEKKSPQGIYFKESHYVFHTTNCAKFSKTLTLISPDGSPHSTDTVIT